MDCIYQVELTEWNKMSGMMTCENCGGATDEKYPEISVSDSDTDYF